MSRTPSEIVQALLKDPTNPDLVNTLVAQNATYVSLNHDNQELKQIMPWAGTAKGPQAIIDTYTRVRRCWEDQGTTIDDILETNGNVAVFGVFTYKSNVTGKAITSPYSILAKVRDEKIVYMQFMEDTFGTASTFRLSAAGRFHSDPQSPEVEL